MALSRLTITIDDNFWPKLHIAGDRVSSTGDRVAFDEKQTYDLAYTAFENTVHNQLRPLVEEIIRRRKPQP